MESGAQPKAKICVRCRRDCSTRPRLKDAAGRYICQECLDREQAAKAAAGPPPGGAPEPAEPEIIPLEGEATGIAVAGAAGARECPNCTMFLSAGAVICSRCGFNTSTGKVFGTDTRASRGQACLHCGYSLAGLKTPRCPECGALNTPAERRRASEAKAARDTVRIAYVKPLIMFAVGFIISASVLGTVEDDWWALVAYLIKYAIYVPTGVLGFFVCCYLWLGFDAPLHLTALRLAAVYAVTDAVGSMLWFLPIPFLAMVIALFVYVGLLADMLELELGDAVIVGFVTFVIRLVGMIAVSIYLIDE